MNVISLAMIFFTAACTVATQMLLKGAGIAVAQIVPEVNFQNIAKLILFAATEPKIVGAITLQAAGFVIWIVVLSREHAAYALGLGGASVYILTALAEWAFYGTRIGISQLLALTVISVGAFLLANSGSQ